MIYSRLVLARNALADDGVIFISLDDNELSQMRQICDEVFGATNLVGTLAWESKTKSQNTLTSFNKLQPKVEYILLYTKGNKRRFNLIKKGNKEYNETDERGAYRWFKMEPMNATGIRGRETMIYPILGVMPPSGKQWQIGIDAVKSLLDAGDVKIEDKSPIIKLRPDGERTEITEPFWGFFSKEIGTAESAKKELKAIIEGHGFETVKPVELIKRLIFHATDENDIILDFFSGSATTAHAVMQLNAEDSGKRKFIMVQLPEVCAEGTEAAKAGYKTICDIGKERIRRAGEKIKTEIETANAQLKIGEEPKKVPDIGFRVLKLDDTNMKDVYYAAGEYTQDLLASMEDNIKDDRTDMDLLYACLLDWGLPLSMSHTQEQVDGFTLHTYNDGDLIACFDKHISDTAVKEIACRCGSSERQGLASRAVFRDSSFTRSPEKINVEEIFKLLAPNTSVKVL